MAEIVLRCGRVALVDDCDFDRLANGRWFVRDRPGRGVYIYGQYLNKQTTLHRAVVDAPARLIVDHINHDTFDNRRSNLRICTNSQNQMNRANFVNAKRGAFKGVTWHKQLRKWQASIKVSGKSVHLGVYESAEAAASAYDAAAKVHFGEFAFVNFREEAI